MANEHKEDPGPGAPEPGEQDDRRPSDTFLQGDIGRAVEYRKEYYKYVLTIATALLAFTVSFQPQLSRSPELVVFMYLGWLGLEQILVGAFAAFVLGGVFSIVMLLAGRLKRGAGIPFGPWMLAGTWVGIVFGDRIAVGYLSLVGLG